MQENPYPGIFIAVEGIDGAGKTTQTKKIVQWFSEHGYSAVYTKEPSYADDRQRLRRVISGETKLSSLGIQELFIEDRELHLEREVIPQIGRKAPTAVVSDRYFLSTLAYGMASGLTFDELWGLHQKIRWFVFPDLTIIIDTEPEEALRHLTEKKNEKDLFEEKEMLEKIQGRYHELARLFRNDNVYLIDGMRTPDAIFSDITQHLEKLVAFKYGRST